MLFISICAFVRNETSFRVRQNGLAVHMMDTGIDSSRIPKIMYYGRWRVHAGGDRHQYTQ